MSRKREDLGDAFKADPQAYAKAAELVSRMIESGSFERLLRKLDAGARERYPDMPEVFEPDEATANDRGK